MQRLRMPFFVVAVVAMMLVILVEVGELALLGGPSGPVPLAADADRLGVAVTGTAGAAQPAGLGLPYLALVDVIALYTVALMAAGLVVANRVQARLQGGLTLVAAIVLIVIAVILLVVAIARLVLMVTLLLAFPFGTIAYLIGWGFFPRGQVMVLLSLLMLLKLVFAGTLVAAQQRFLQNKGLVAMVLTSLVTTVVATFLYGVVPGILVSIIDAIAAIVFAVVAIVWAVVLAVGALPAIVKAVRATAALKALEPPPPV